MIRTISLFPAGETGTLNRHKRLRTLSVLIGIMLILTALVLLPVSISLAEEETEPIVGPVAKTEAELNTMLDSGESVTTMIGEPFYENVTDEDVALEAMGSVMERLGCDDTTRLVLDTVRSTEDNLTVYTFRQQAGDLAVYGGIAKLIVDKNGTAVAAVATVYPDMPDTTETVWEITEEEAEELVRDMTADDKARVLTGLTHQTLLPIAGYKLTYYAWVVYTDNPWQWSEAAYVAHYLNENGEYILSQPVSEPWSTDSLSGAGTEFVFAGLEESSWTGEVTMFDGRKEEITVPTMTNPETGEVFLGDLKRKIACADFSDFYNDNTITLVSQENGSWYDGDLLTMMNMTKVWDFYNEIGWTGPDGDGTPVLLLMNWVDKNGEPVKNACYRGKENGFQVFAFNRVERDGECMDILGHEYTHCVSNSLASDLPYLNDIGAIDEALSDIMGNLIESYITDNDDPEWLIGEGSRDPGMILRCMSDPHRYRQPAYTWDLYYAPNAEIAKEENDCGGVHINSSLLNLIAWRLHEKGMPVEDEFYYWMNVVMAIVPGMDYPMMAELLPWSMAQVGYNEWLPVLEAAIRETRIAETEPGSVPDGCFAVYCDLPESMQENASKITLSFLDQDLNVIGSTWPDERLKRILYIMPAGEYQLLLQVFEENGDISSSWIMTTNGWSYLGEDSGLPEETLFTLEEGGVYELKAGGLP